MNARFLFFAVAVPLASLSVCGQQPSGNPGVEHRFRDLENGFPPDKVGRFEDFQPTAFGCDMVLEIVAQKSFSNQNGSYKPGDIVAKDPIHFGDPCPEVKDRYQHGTTVQPPVQPYFIIPIGTGIGTEPASSGKTPPGRQAGSSGTVILDLPLEPPLAAGRRSADSDGCDPSATVLFRVTHTKDTVTRIDGCPWRVTATIPVASRPLQAAFTPDGKTLLVTSYDNAITFIDPATNKVTFTLLTPGNVYPSGIAISPDGATAYITSFIDFAPAIVVLDIARRRITATIPLAIQYPQSVFLSPDGSTAWVVFPFSASVTLVDTLTQTVAATIGNIPNPQSIAFNRTGTTAYVASSGSLGAIKVVDTSTLAVTSSYDLAGDPGEVQIDAYDRYLIVQGYTSPNSYVIDLTTGAVNSFPGKPFRGGLRILD